MTDNSAFLKNTDHFNAVIRNSESLRKVCDDYYLSAIESFNSLLQPYENRILNKLYSMKFLPSVVSKKKKLRVLNNINCESHLDKFVFTLKQMIIKN